jgi:acyl-coenzyme A synthetase/AMP-(fatty) acid ligase
LSKGLWGKITHSDQKAPLAFNQSEARLNEVLAELDSRGVKSINLIPKKENQLLVQEARKLTSSVRLVKAKTAGIEEIKASTKILSVRKVKPHIHVFPETSEGLPSDEFGSGPQYESKEMNPLKVLAYYAKISPDSLAIVNEKRSITFSQLYVIVRQFAIKFKAAGIQPGDLVLTRLPSTLDWISTLALMSQGAITCSRSGRTPIDPSMGPKYLVSDGSFIWKSNNTIIINDAWITDAERSNPADLADLEIDAKSPCRIIFTNGTIGEPKAVELSLELLNARTDQYNRTWLTEKSIMPLLDLSATMGFFAFYSLFVRGEKIVTSSQLNFDTVRVALSQEVEVFVASPLRVVQLLEIIKRTETTMPKLNKVVISGNTPTLKLLNNIATALDVEVLNIYGSTECGDISFLPISAQTKASDAGWVYPEAKVQIVDAAGQVVSSEIEGLIGTSSPTMVHGYFRTKSPNRKVFHDGWFYSGDTGYLTADGRLMLTGRDNELIDLGKMKVNPQLIEELVLDYAGVLDCGVFTYENVSGAHILAVAVVGDKDLNLKVMTSAIARELGEMSPKTYFIVDKIPRDSLGKVLRSELQKDIKRKISNRKNGNGGKS